MCREIRKASDLLFECTPVSMAEAATLLPILRDAEEGDERIQATFLNPACVAYAARVDGLLIGAAVVRWDEHEGSELLYIAVIAEQRGKGYGKRIIAALQAELAARSGRALLVGTANSSLENIAFYQKCGFRMFAIRRDYFAYIQPPLQEHGIIMRDMIVLCYERA
jgi:ribosomal protein S18 acetylase RimI-like enzyme